MIECLILGGGVIGLSLAYELAGRGRSVQVFEREQPGRAASWAGAGILPPMLAHSDNTPLEGLSAMSLELHPRWAAGLREETGIDTEFRICGGTYVSLTNRATLASDMDRLACMGVAVQTLIPAEVRAIEPALAVPPQEVADEPAAYHLPQEAQLRNPRHLKALIAGCRQRGAVIVADAEASEFRCEGARVRAVRVGNRWTEADQFCIATGAWSSALAAQIGLEIAVRPIRGQMALLHHHPNLLNGVINCDRQYLVPRRDGRVLVGATQEEAGFDLRTTARGIGDLLALARQLVPELGDASVETSWAGLRPGNVDGLPYLGRHPKFDNLFVATGHFRNGLHLSPATAVLISDLMGQQTLSVDLAPFSLDRHAR